MTTHEKKSCKIIIRRTITLTDSAILQQLDYDVNTLELFITFHPNRGRDYGDTYLYSGVPENVVKDLINSKSAGSYFREFIRDQYPTEKIDLDD